MVLLALPIAVILCSNPGLMHMYGLRFIDLDFTPRVLSSYSGFPLCAKLTFKLKSKPAMDLMLATSRVEWTTVSLIIGNLI